MGSNPISSAIHFVTFSQPLGSSVGSSIRLLTCRSLVRTQVEGPNIHETSMSTKNSDLDPLNTRDISGQLLDVGDKVAYSVQGRIFLRIGEIIRFNKKTITVGTGFRPDRPSEYWHRSNPDGEGTCFRKPNEIVRVSMGTPKSFPTGDDLEHAPHTHATPTPSVDYNSQIDAAKAWPFPIGTKY